LAGVNPYGAVLPSTNSVLLSGFPASLLAGGLEDRTRVGLADDTKVKGVTVLLPVVDGVKLHQADILTTETCDRFVVAGVESVAGIWRLSVLPVVS
jgi:hypothetical protein